MKEQFLELINDKSKSAEEIFNIMYEKYKDKYHTQKIFRGLKSWENCLYQGTIGEDDFIMSEASSTVFDFHNVKMIFDNYKQIMIRFIELFREAYKMNPNDHIINLTIMASKELINDIFAGASRDDELAKVQRNKSSEIDKDEYLMKYKMSSQTGKGKSAVCCERNATVGNLFQFVGIETYHVVGLLRKLEAPGEFVTEPHAFTLIKYGKDPGKFAIIDAYNDIIIKNALPGDYDFSQGFRYSFFSKKHNKQIDYILEGPLYEINDEILKTESYIRKLETSIQNIETTGNLTDLLNLKKEFEDLILFIKISHLSDTFKKRFIDRINNICLQKINRLEIKFKSLNSDKNAI